MGFAVTKKTWRCQECGFCEVICSRRSCIGCGVCVDACPHEAKVSGEIIQRRNYVKIEINGEKYGVPTGITVLRALEMVGFTTLRYKEGEPRDKEIFAPCRTGGCWSCAVIINDELRPSCITPIEEGMKIVVGREEIEKKEPKRIVSGFHGHPVGGVGTPYWVKPRAIPYKFIEVACFAHGCILRCATCQNWSVVYSAVEEPLSPAEAATIMSYERRRFEVDRMAISGGEATLNKKWLLSYLKELKARNKDRKARLHVDTNAVILTKDYVDALFRAGITDIGTDVKGLKLESFMRITGIKEKELAEKLLDTEWKAVKYLIDCYGGKIFIGIGIPYNEALISMEEMYRIGERIARWEPEVQVCALDYRGEFRRNDIKKPSYEDMRRVKKVLENSGLKHVICQTEFGFMGPSLVGTYSVTYLTFNITLGNTSHH